MHPPTFGALPPVQTNASILTFEFSAFQPDILNSVVTGPNNREFFIIRTPTPTCTVIYKSGTPFCTINWQTNPTVEAEGIIGRQRTGEFLKLAADSRWARGTNFRGVRRIVWLRYFFYSSYRSMTVHDTGKVYAWIPRGTDVIVCVHNNSPFTIYFWLTMIIFFLLLAIQCWTKSAGAVCSNLDFQG